ncbi:MAG: aminopeptidase [Acidobacteriota bacterium]|nr:aminopeptidase [Acidobacteriota bacterium]
MKQLCRITPLVIGLFVVMGVTAWAEGPDYEAIAENLVNQSLAVQPGEIVVISGNPSEVELMGVLQVAVAKAGGQSMLALNIPEANKRSVMETPIEHLEQLPTAGLLLNKMADVFINVGSVQDPDLFADVPEERLSAGRKAGLPLTRAFNNMRSRSATLGQTGGIPTETYAASVGASHKEVSAIFWQAVSVSPAELASNAKKLTAMMTNGAVVRMTSDVGTDLTFQVDQLPARINAARTADVKVATGPSNVWLPAGEAYACVKKGSASGTLVVPWTSFRGVPVKNLKLTFANGRVSKLSAASDVEILEQYFAASSPELGDLSLFDLGLNPHSRTPTGSHYYSWEMDGMVTLGLGNNGWAGGDNESDAALSLHVPGSTLRIGDKTVVKNGKLGM